MAELELQGAKPAPKPTKEQVAEQVKVLEALAAEKAFPAGDRGEVIVKADIHEVVTKYSDGTTRRDILAKQK